MTLLSSVIDHSPVPYPQLKSPFEIATQGLRDNLVEVIAKSGYFLENSVGDGLVELIDIVQCAFSPLNRSQVSDLPLCGEDVERGCSTVLSIYP